MKAIIMAGGEGSRLRPMTCELPKPLVPLLGRPVMSYALELLAKHGIHDTAATIGYRGDQIRARMGGGLRYFEEETPLGTAGSIKAASDWLDRTFIVLSGDALTDLDITSALAFHRAKGAAATLILKRVANPLEYGVVVADRSGRIRGFIEKPTWRGAVSDTVNTGIYILEPEVLHLIPDGKYDFGSQLFPTMAKRGDDIFAYVTDSYWCDVGDARAYIAAQRDMLLGRVALPLPARCRQAGASPAGDGYTLETPCYIGDECVIERGAVIGRGSVIGDRAYIGREAVLRGSVLWDGARVGPGARVGAAVLCCGASLGRGAAAGDGAVVGAQARIGDGAELAADSAVWPGCHVEDGARVHGSVLVRDDLGRRGFSGALTPEEAALLGAALATVLMAERVCCGASGGAGADVLAQAFLAGAASVGADCTSLGACQCAALVYGACERGAGAAAHIAMVDGEVKLRLFAGTVPLTRAQEAKLARAARRPDFERIPLQRMRPVADVAYAQRLYLAWRAALLDGPKAVVTADTRGDGELPLLYLADGTTLDDRRAAAVLSAAARALARQHPALEAAAELDGELALGLLGLYLAENGLSLDALAARVGGCSARISVDCPHRLKGAVMRRMAERTGRFDCSGADGLNVDMELGRLSVAPGDSERLDIAVTSMRAEFAQELALEYKNAAEALIRSLRREDGE